MKIEQKFKKISQIKLKSIEIRSLFDKIFTEDQFIKTFLDLKNLLPICFKPIDEIDSKLDNEIDELLIHTIRNLNTNEILNCIHKIEKLLIERKKYI